MDYKLTCFEVSPGHDNSGEAPQKTANEGEDDNLLLANIDKDNDEYGEAEEDLDPEE